MPVIVMPVEFRFKIKGNLKKALQSIKEQINNDINEYQQFLHPNAEFLSLEFKEWREE